MQVDGTRYQPPPPDPTRPNESQHWHPCYTNPKAVEIALEKARAAFDKGEICFSLGINDGLRAQCQCPKCKAAGWPGAYYQFVTKVAEAVKDRYPPHLIGVLVYGDVRHPPDNLKLPPNVFALVAGASPLAKWSRHAVHLGKYDYFYGQGFVVPSFPMKAMAWNARIFQESRVLSHRVETRPVWANDAPKLAIQSRLWWNPTLDVRAELRKFCDAAFGPAGTDMTTYYERWASKWDYLVRENIREPAPMCDMSSWNSSSAQFEMVKAEDYELAGACIARASAAKLSEKQRARLEMVRTWFEYSKALFGLHTRTQAIFAGKTEADLAATFEQLTAERGKVDQLEAAMASHPEWSLGVKPYVRRAGWTIDKNIRSALITSLLALQGTKALPKPRQLALPEWLRAYTAPFDESASPPRIKTFKDSIYYAGPGMQYRYSPMQLDAEGDTVSFRTDQPMALVEQGNETGSYKTHWGFFLATPKQRLDSRLLLRITVEATGREGDLTVRLENPWKVDDKDGLPVEIAAPLTGTAARAKRSFVVEPVLPDSPHRQTEFGVRVVLTWEPTADTASCAGTVQVTQVDMDLQAAGQ